MKQNHSKKTVDKNMLFFFLKTVIPPYNVLFNQTDSILQCTNGFKT